MRRRGAGFCLVALAVASQVALAQAPTAAAAPSPDKAVVSIIHLADDKSEALRGNGFLISADGVIVTNYHLVYGAAGLQIRLANGDIYDQANIRALDPILDVAVLKIPAFNSPFIPLAQGVPEDGAARLVEQAVGKKQGASWEVRVSKAPVAPDLEVLVLDRNLDAQTKGCPLVDSAGAAFAVTTLAFVPKAGGAVAVPVKRVKDLLTTKKMNRPLGMMDWRQWASVLDPAVVEQLGQSGIVYRPLPEGIRTDKSLRRRLAMALEFDPTDPKCRALLARVCMQEFDYEGAGAHINELSERSPDDPEVLLLKGDLLYHLGDYDGARAAYLRIAAAGYQAPANYDANAKGIIIRNVLHDHALLSCKGPVILSENQLRFRPEDLTNDDFTTPYPNIASVKLEIQPEAGQLLYKFQLKFAHPVGNRWGTWTKEDFQLRIMDREVAENFEGYLEKRGIPVARQGEK
jgi:hypothetical protein